MVKQTASRIPQYIISVLLFVSLLTLFNYYLLLPFRIFALIIAVGALVELSVMLYAKHKTYPRSLYTMLTIIGGMTLPIITITLQLRNASQHYISHILIISAPILFIACATADILLRSRAHARDAASKYSVNTALPLAMIYIGAPLVMLLYVAEHPHAPLLLGAACAATALFDTFSYIFGRRFGGTRTTTRKTTRTTATTLFTISPNKTIAGLIGGLTTTLLIMTPILLWTTDLFARHLPAILLILILTLFAALMGDLFESLIKRSAHVKDSGTIVRGRGGILDSIDSYLFAIPVFSGLYFTLY